MAGAPKGNKVLLPYLCQILLLSLSLLIQQLPREARRFQDAPLLVLITIITFVSRESMGRTKIWLGGYLFLVVCVSSIFKASSQVDGAGRAGNVEQGAVLKKSVEGSQS